VHREFFEWPDAPEADFAVIGSPIHHSLSPLMHAAAYRELGLNYRYVAVHVPPGEVGRALDRLERLGYRGVNVTVPHKEEVLGSVDVADAFAKRVGAANTARLRSLHTREVERVNAAGRFVASDFREATNTDAPGFLKTLQPLSMKGKRVTILGAGGSARAIVAILVDNGYLVQIYNRTRQRAIELVEQLGVSAAVLDRPNLDADLIVNTTSAGLAGQSLNLDWSQAPAHAVAYDLVYGDTVFLREARKAALGVVDGLSLLVEQGALAFEWWTGLDAPRISMMDAVKCES
jgi:shikimate dehydrogenase